MNEDSKLYAASILKLAYLYYAQDKINQGEYTLDSSFKYVPEVNSFPGSYKPEGSGSLPKKEDNKESFFIGLYCYNFSFSHHKVTISVYRS